MEFPLLWKKKVPKMLIIGCVWLKLVLESQDQPNASPRCSIYNYYCLNNDKHSKMLSKKFVIGCTSKIYPMYLVLQKSSNTICEIHYQLHNGIDIKSSIMEDKTTDGQQHQWQLILTFSKIALYMSIHICVPI